MTNTQTANAKMALLRALLVLLAFCARIDCFAELVTLTIGPGEFPEPSSVSVFVDAGLLGEDEVLSSISGDIVVDLLPDASDPTMAQIVEFNAQVDDAIDFRVGGGLLLPRVTVAADPGEIKVALVEPGLPADIEFGGFSQFENLVAFEGVVQTSVQPEPFDLAEQEPTLIDIEDIDLIIDGPNITLSGALVTETIIPIEAGFLTFNVVVGVDGEVTASGMLPTGPPVAPRIPGDTDENGTVDFTDFLVLSAGFGGAGDWSQGDFDGDGQIGFPDFLVLSSNFGTSQAANQVAMVVPEPDVSARVWLLLVLGVSVLRRRGR